MNITETNYSDLLIIRKDNSTDELQIIINDLHSRDYIDVYKILPKLHEEMGKKIY